MKLILEIWASFGVMLVLQTDSCRSVYKRDHRIQKEKGVEAYEYNLLF